MAIKIAELMTETVITTRPHKSVGHVRDIMNRNHIQALPIVDSNNELLGIVTASDLLENLNETSPVSKIMTDRVYTIPLYSKVSEAARCMRNHHIHHLVVTHEKQVAGVVSSFDLLKLVEEHHYIRKQKTKSTS